MEKMNRLICPKCGEIIFTSEETYFPYEQDLRNIQMAMKFGDLWLVQDLLMGLQRQIQDQLRQEFANPKPAIMTQTEVNQMPEEEG